MRWCRASTSYIVGRPRRRAWSAEEPLDVIEGPLMDGMNVVGDLFGSRQDVPAPGGEKRPGDEEGGGPPEPFMEEEQVPSARAGTVLMATVKGDVHDIGKNIVGVVLQCNNYDVIDLGVMVPADRILHRSQGEERRHHRAVGPDHAESLDEMVHVAKRDAAPGLRGAAAHRRGHHVEGAHRGEDRAPLRARCGLRHRRLACAGVGVGRSWWATTSRPTSPRCARSTTKTCASAARTALLAQSRCPSPRPVERVPLDLPRTTGVPSARASPTSPACTSWTSPSMRWCPTSTGRRSSTPGTWFAARASRGSSTSSRPEAQKLYDDGLALLDRIVNDDLLQARARGGFLACGVKTATTSAVARGARQPRRRPAAHAAAADHRRAEPARTWCLADYVSPNGGDWMGAFAVTTGLGLERAGRRHLRGRS